MIVRLDTNLSRRLGYCEVLGPKRLSNFGEVLSSSHLGGKQEHDNLTHGANLKYVEAEFEFISCPAGYTRLIYRALSIHVLDAQCL